ncbi:hypothetical protein [Nocardia sp. NPDC023988]|uniref:AbiTii domain-containing protein n=1 Tax=unclassified Nocardia TaxID=2637762 RepID=UPI0033D1FC99
MTIDADDAMAENPASAGRADELDTEGRATMVGDAGLLRDLRDRVLDEDESLSGLLRTCLALGIATGSSALQSWAASELKGYKTAAEVPDYRKVPLQLFVDSLSLSNVIVREQPVSRDTAPANARELIPYSVSLLSPLEQLIVMAEGESHYHVRLPILKRAAAEWNVAQNSDPMIFDMYYKMDSNTASGVVSVVRTTLLEMVLDMAKHVPLDQLPTRRQADTAVQVHAGGSYAQYRVDARNNSGVIGQGPAATQTQHSGPHPAEQQRRRWFRRPSRQ